MTTRSLPTPQHFYQQVIQKYGWYSKYDTNENDCWFLEVIVGLKSKWIVLQSNEHDLKIAKTILSSHAILVLQDDIAKEEAKPLQSLSQVFPNPIVIHDSDNDNTWKRFWDTKPSVVGIDVEGNQKCPPVLVQISTDDYTILEVPQDKLSDDLVRLLGDDDITKILCDNGAHKDKKCLGLYNSDAHDGNASMVLMKPPVVDLEVLFGSFAGPVKAARGLSKIMAMCLELPTSSCGFKQVLDVRIGKPKQASQRMKSVGRFALIEQGKIKPLKGLKDLKQKEKQYAALDAWCTLQAYHRLVELQRSYDLLTEPSRITVDGNVNCEDVESMTDTNMESKDAMEAVDKESKEWLLRENQRLSVELQARDKQLKDAQSCIAKLETEVKSLQAGSSSKGSKAAGGNRGKKGGGRGGRGNNNRKQRQAASNQNQNQQQQ